MVRIIQATEDKQFEQAKELFIEYSHSLGIDLCFQNFNKELNNLPWEYENPEGSLLLALDDEHPVGCVALRQINKGICEMKRLYVKPEWNGQGMGKRLVTSIIDDAKSRGYKFLRLDTLPSMKVAISLYRSLGFYEIEPYRINPIKGALYFELNLC
ncbi:GNAT family N-acetyltransferase [Bacillus massilinigeriensis]|uniref:GNAT family N-acetyltransferase n=1 Tax=Bacillus massilionigeriensis TaxID=1805475 RepID=UPI00096B1A03|nr:GNAT family N-acetyltransferase [Bacillus massilionigeriensis]